MNAPTSPPMPTPTVAPSKRAVRRADSIVIAQGAMGVTAPPINRPSTIKHCFRVNGTTGGPLTETGVEETGCGFWPAPFAVEGGAFAGGVVVAAGPCRCTSKAPTAALPAVRCK